MRRLTNRQLASHLGCRQEWVGKVLLGHVPAPARFRTGLAELLGVEAEELFH
jgi:hypothetical protein